MCIRDSSIALNILLSHTSKYPGYQLVPQLGDNIVYYSACTTSSSIRFFYSSRAYVLTVFFLAYGQRVNFEFISDISTNIPQFIIHPLFLCSSNFFKLFTLVNLRFIHKSNFNLVFRTSYSIFSPLEYFMFFSHHHSKCK